MNLYSIETGNFMLDGGAMFGVVPKSLWNKVYPADKNNMCNLSLRCLLIETKEQLILIDTGLGNKQNDKFFGHYYLNGTDTLEKSLQKAGFNKTDVTDVILTHLHFDHCGGAVEKEGDSGFRPAFPNARFWISGPQWHWAMEPNQREKASFLLENFEPLEKTGTLNFINREGKFNNEIELRLFNGHTEGLMIPFIHYKNRTLVYVSDLIPTAFHIPLSWICGFDTRPLLSMNAHNLFLEEALNKSYTLFFEHDIYHECCILEDTEKGVRMKESFTLRDFTQKS
jgi:glyoxylase-like metal-dependent hydrolase (beta-lactamase superfamily II)